MTGEDASPPYKKRLLSRSATGKVQTPPSGSPNQSLNVAVTSPSKIAGAIDPRGVKRSVSTVAQVGSTSSSVHTLFATNFFNNVSVGYNVLLHTFQYLKVQVSNTFILFIY